MRAFSLKKRERLRSASVATPPARESARTSTDELHARVALALEAEIEVKIPRDVAEEVRRTRPGENLAIACLALIREALGRREAEPVGGDSLIARVERLEALIGSGVVASKRRLEVGEEGATLDGRRVRLAPNEHRILQRLARAEGEWIELDGDRYAVWKGISRLRQALESAGLRRPIENRRGRYRLDPDCVSVFSRSEELA
jgi:DNA-binding response OmpR family regulator